MESNLQQNRMKRLGTAAVLATLAALAMVPSASAAVNQVDNNVCTSADASVNVGSPPPAQWKSTCFLAVGPCTLTITVNGGTVYTIVLAAGQVWRVVVVSDIGATVAATCP